MKKTFIWISAMRLRTLPLSLSGIIIASSFAYYSGCFNWKIFVLAILTAISLQILSNLANDYGDGLKGTDNKDRIGPVRSIQSGKINPESMFKVIKLNILICIVLALLLIFAAFGSQHLFLTTIFFALGIISVLAAVQYTMGKNAYGYKGLGDVFVFIFFGLVSVIGCYILYARTIHHIVFLPSITIGLLSVAVLNLNNMRDIKSDALSGKETLALKLGAIKAKQYHVFLISSAIIISFLFGILYFTSLYNLIYFLAYIPLVLHLKKIKKINNPKDYNPELKKVALTTFMLSILLALGYLL